MHQTDNASVRWWQALNPPIYLISILPGVAVWLLSDVQGRQLAAVTAATLAVVLLQHAINVLNDVSDWRLGADVDKHHTWVRFHRLALRTTALHGFVSLTLGVLLGLAVLAVTDQLRIVLVAAPLVLLGYLYNSGRRPLSYTHLGEWITGLCYAGVFGCLWLLATGNPSRVAAWGSAAFFALAVALLLSHQPPQIETDRQAGKLSFAVRYGAQRTYAGARLLYLLFLLTFGLALLGSTAATGTTIAFIALAAATGLPLLRMQPSPRHILAAGSALILGLVLVEALLQPISGNGFD
ncbi:MAG: UbiA family prenyltransferase [Gammaproteobacteria bacterium]